MLKSNNRGLTPKEIGSSRRNAQLQNSVGFSGYVQHANKLIEEQDELDDDKEYPEPMLGSQ
jgi:hypothetical protein